MKRISQGIIFSLWAMTLASCEQPSQQRGGDDGTGLVSLTYETSDGALELPKGFAFHHQFSKPGKVPGISGEALRLDGFSSWVEGRVSLDAARPFTAQTWIVLESYPADIEGPVSDLSPSSIMNQVDDDAGFDIYMDTYGRWGLRFETDKETQTLKAPDLFPLGEWVHVASAYDPPADKISLYLNGQLVGSSALNGAVFKPANTPLFIGKSVQDVKMLNFIINRMNGALDDTLISQRALSESELRTLYETTEKPEGHLSLIVPGSRFERDHLRPRFHAMPPANWTNEPHGFVRKGDDWHLFYQRTPNGPFKTQMNWGHMVTQDLVTWEHLPDALRPSLQTEGFGYDMKGIWSGDVVMQGDTAIAYYTSVNHSPDYFNPGISIAISNDARLEMWEKRGPIIDTTFVKDMRDPYLWEEDNGWHMIIGAEYEHGGGLDYWTCPTKAQPDCWEHREKFISVPYSQLDIGSYLWEMPVFEPLGDKHILLVNPVGDEVQKYADKPTQPIYWTGMWKDGQFTPDYMKPKPMELVPGHLSPVIERENDGTIVAFGIVDERRSNQAQEDAGWTHTYALPRNWQLMPDKETLGQSPSPRLETLRREEISASTKAGELTEVGHGYEIKVNFDSQSNWQKAGLTIAATADGTEKTIIYFDRQSGQIILDKSGSTLSKDGMEGPQILKGDYDIAAFGMPEQMHVFVDGSVVDVFVNNAAAFSIRTYPSRSDATHMSIYNPDKKARVTSLDVWTLGAE